MAYEVGGKRIETNENGYLLNQEDWSREVAGAIAEDASLELSDRAWDVLEFLRDEFFEQGGNQPNDRNIVKAMSKKWGQKIGTKDIYNLFPRGPSKQAGMIAGLPESRRKGGY